MIRFRSIRLFSRITLFNHKDDAQSGHAKNFFAVIDATPETKEALKASLISKGLVCMDYIGHPTKVAVGFGESNFVNLMDQAVQEVGLSPN